MRTQKNKLLQIENEFNIGMAIDYVSDNERDLDDYIRVIFLLMDFLVNGQYSEKEHGFVVNMIKKFFLESKPKYLHNPEYLFYIGFIASMSEWYLDLEWGEVESMLKNATCIEPQNFLYQWGYNSIIDQRVEVNTKMKHSLSKQILEDSLQMNSIREKGLLGKYLESIIQNEYEATKAILE